MSLRVVANSFRSLAMYVRAYPIVCSFLQFLIILSFNSVASYVVSVHTYVCMHMYIHMHICMYIGYTYPLLYINIRTFNNHSFHRSKGKTNNIIINCISTNHCDIK